MKLLLVCEGEGDDDDLVALTLRVRRPKTDADVAIGVASPEHEAWVLAALEPASGAEREAHARTRERLGFDPCAQGERLTSKRETDPKDAKRVLREVCDDHTRRRALFVEADLDRLRARGVAVGLTAFLDELKARVASAYDPPGRRRPYP